MPSTLNENIRQTGPHVLLVPILLMMLLIPGFSQAQEKNTSHGGRFIVCMIQLDHADAEYLASVVKPFLSPEGSIAPDKPTNTLIIKDRAPVVNMLSQIISGKQCVPNLGRPDVENSRQKEAVEPDR